MARRMIRMDGAPPVVDATGGIIKFQVVDVVVTDSEPPAFDCVTNDDMEGDGFLDNIQMCQRSREKKCIVLIFGCTANGESIMCRVENYKPALYYKQDSATSVHRKRIGRQVNVDPDDLSSAVVYRRNAYGWEPNRMENPTDRKEHAYVEIRFPTIASLKEAAKNSRCHEGFIDIETKFMDDMNCTPSGWMWVRGRVVNERMSHCYHEVSCTTKQLGPVMDGGDAVAPLMAAYFDIEAVSEALEFPDADKPRDHVTHIGIHFQRINSTAIERVQLVLGECDPVEGVAIESCASEQDLLNRARTWIRRRDPDIIVQFNGFGFDWPYLVKRSQQAHIRADTFMYLSRLIADRCTMRTKELSSSALGQNDLSIVNMKGRINLDLYHWIKAQPNYKFTSYKLDHLAEHFLGDHKVDMDYRDLFKLAQGTRAEKAKVAHYCDVDVELLSRLCRRLKIYSADAEMSRICHTLQEQLVTRGQQIKVINQLKWYGNRNKRRPDGNGGYILNTPESFSGTSNDSYEGATVIDAVAGYYKDRPVAVLDFMSLYPSIILAHKFCYSTLVQNPEFLRATGIKFVTIRVSDTKVYTFADMEGILQDMLHEILSARKAAKRLKAVAANEDDAAVYGAREKALKVSANSVYGFTGAMKTGKYPCLAVADSVTFKAREMLTATVQYIQEFAPCRVIYGDTDSVMVIFEGADTPEEAFVLGEKGANAVTDRFPPDIILEMEKVYWPYYLFKKKRYAGLMHVSKNGEVIVEGIDAKGIELVRRDNCPFAKEVYQSMLDSLMYKRDEKEALCNLQIKLDELTADRVPREKFVLSKTLRKDYSNKEAQVHWRVVEKMRQRRPGSEPRPGERVPYIFVVNKDPKAKTCERGEDPKYAAENRLPIDRLYYLEHQIITPAVTLLSEIHPAPQTLFDDAKQRIKRQQTPEQLRLQGQLQITSFTKPVEKTSALEAMMRSIRHPSPVKPPKRKKQKK